MNKVLKVRNSLMDNESLKKYLSNFASNNKILKRSNKETYPISRLKDNINYLNLVCTLLNSHLKLGIPIHPAGEWLLDNFYIIDEISKSIEKNLTLKSYCNLNGVNDDGFARIYVLANEIVSCTDGKITKDSLIDFLQAYQTQRNLLINEIWNINVFIELCLIEKIRKTSEQIFVSQIQKFKAFNIAENYIKNRKINNKINIELNDSYSFIEFLSFKLKEYGKISIPFLDSLENEVAKRESSIQTIVSRVHYEESITSLSIENSILSLKLLNRISIYEIYEKISVVEKLLDQDPANVYKKMDFESKAYYRNKIVEISKKTKTSEIYITRIILNLCNENENKEETNNIDEKIKTHVGYYLLNENGKKLLLEKLLNKKIGYLSYDAKSKIYVYSILILSTLLLIFLCQYLNKSFILLFIPIINVVTKIIQYNINKIKKKICFIPKIYYKSVPKESKTMCAFPCILNNEKDVYEMFDKMEVYYLANKSDNLYFSLLGDCSSSNKKELKIDEKIIEAGLEKSKELCEKYGEIFFFLYRNRKWNASQKCYMGWERKRGLLLNFNDFLLTNKSVFRVNTIKKNLDIKYVITADSDTNLILNSVFKLIGAMDHILNKPHINKIKNIVDDGYAIIQPRIGIDINHSRKTTFSRIFSESGGLDLYTNAISDIYQDLFDRGTYTGKGIYNLKVYNKILKNEIPENKILSHDLIEGELLHCAIASDIVLLDEYPSNYKSYKKRQDRWIRGDLQNLIYLKSNLSFFSKYKIFDNIFRDLNELFIFITFILMIITQNNNFLFVPVFFLAMPMIIELVDNVIIDGKFFNVKLISKKFNNLQKTIYRFIISLLLLPDLAILEFNALIKTVYRMTISKSNLLDWTTSRDAEKNNDNSISFYYNDMIKEVLIGVFLLIFSFYYGKINILNLIGLFQLEMMWIFAPLFIHCLCINKKKKEMNVENKNELVNIAKNTWKFFKDNMVNYLIIDNYQEEGREEKKAYRTSPTNIGFELLAIISSYDLHFENIEDTIDLLSDVIEVVDSLEKWNGHLYNWYDLNTLKPLSPYDISSVDSGNFISMLYVTKSFLIDLLNKKIETEYKNKINKTLKIIESMIDKCNFKTLYDNNVELFSISYNVKDNLLNKSYYDLLASEARQTSYVSIAKGDISSKHFSKLNRNLSYLNKHIGLISWGGTSFEYLMPAIYYPSYDSSMLNESEKFLIYSDIIYGKKLNIPWGISESQFNLKDLYGNYQYKTFGIPWISLRRANENEIVVSPYSTFLALNIYPNDNKVFENINRLKKENSYGKYGFYEAIDYSKGKKVIKTFMAHHEGMILSSINNAINDNIFSKRMMENKEMKKIDILFQEKMPESIILKKNNVNGKIKKVKSKEIVNDCKVRIPKLNEKSNIVENVNLISSNTTNFVNIFLDNGDIISKFNDIVLSNNFNIIIRNIKNDKIYNVKKIIENRLLNLNMEFFNYKTKISFEDGNLKCIIEDIISPNINNEIRKITIINKQIEELNLEVGTFEDIILSNINQYNAHKCYDKMFLNYYKENNNIIIERKPRTDNEKRIFMCKTLFSSNDNLKFEIDKEKFLSRNNLSIEDSFKKEKSFSNKIELTINPILALKKEINIKVNSKENVYYLTSIEYDKDKCISDINEYQNFQELNRIDEIAKVNALNENRYLNISEDEVMTYQNILKYLIKNNQEVFENYEIKNDNKEEKIKCNFYKLDLSDSRLWKYGISGDFPIILVIINNESEFFVAKEILKAFNYYKLKNIKTELVFLLKNDVKKNLIMDYIMSEKMERFINKREGIFIIDNNEELNIKERELLEIRANLIIDGKNGSISNMFREDFL